MVQLTIGMATYKDFDGVYFTLQALRLYQDLEDTELIVVDNYGCQDTKDLVEGWLQGRYVLAKEVVGTAAAKNLVFREASGEAVLCCDSHVLFAPAAIARLKEYYRAHPDSIDLLQGPLVYDDGRSISTHFEPEWRGEMWGTWATDPRGEDPNGEPFEIPMQGMGVFSCRKSAWPGFNPLFRGFGGEEGYIHEKVRQAGGRCLCLPWLRWMHRFGRPSGVPYPLTVEDKLRNYVIGHAELGLDLAPVLTHFSEVLGEDKVIGVAEEALVEALADALADVDWDGDAAADRDDSVPAPAGAGGSRGKKRKRGKKANGKGKKGWVSDIAILPAPASGLHAGKIPLVSCICVTYNRAPDHQVLPEEAIESFLRQTYPNKELIVLNDCPGQSLVCDAPGVRAINLPDRCPTLGDKCNAAIDQAHGELIAPWDDDDISLPWRLSLSVERLGDAGYFNPRCYWFWDNDGLHDDHPVGYAHNASLFTRAAFETVGRYPAVSVGYDAEMDSALLARIERVVDPHRGALALTRGEWFYIYRWGVSPVHVSSRVSPDDTEVHYRQIGTLPVKPGRFHLRPHWRQDYVAATRRLLKARPAAVA